MAEVKRRNTSGDTAKKNPPVKKKSTYKRGSARKKRVKAKRRKIMMKRALTALICVGLVYGIIQLMLFMYVRKYDGDTVLEGVYVDDLHVGGMTLEQVKAELDQQLLDYGTRTLKLKVSDEKGDEALYSELGVSADTKKLAQEALNYGKEGSLFSRWSQIRKCEKDDYVITIKYSVDEKAAGAVLEERCASLYTGAVDATLAHKKGKLAVTEGQDGKALDTKATIAVINEFLNDNWDGRDGTIQVKSKTVEPRVHAKDLENVKDLIGTYKTTYTNTDSASVANIESGAAHLNGTVVMPGEEFSVNEGMSPYTEEEGYVEAASYANGEVVQTMGGGICQVSTTVYNALLFAELEITERYPHSMMISYVEPSMDAAIADDIKDLKFVNNYDTAIYIECITKDRTLTVNIFGEETRPSGRTLEFVSEVLSKDVPENPKFVATNNKVGYYQTLSSARTGYTAKLWKVVYEDGEEVSREQVNSSTYRSAQQVIGVGTATDDAAHKKRITAAIATQDEEKIKDAISGKDVEREEAEKKAQEQAQEPAQSETED